MQLSDRNSRLVLVGTGIGLFGYILPKIVDVIKTSFSGIYIDSFPIGVGHVFSSTLFANALLILGVGICYCYHELHNYGNYDSNESAKYIERSDKYYRMLLNISYTSFFMILFLNFILLFIVPLVFSNPLITSIITAIIIALVLTITIRKWKQNWFKEIFKWFQGLKKYSLHGGIIAVWLLVLPTTMILGLNDNLDTKFKIKFNTDKNPQVEFEFSDHVPDKMPKEISIEIGTTSKQEEILLRRDDFNASFTEVTETEDNNTPLGKYINNHDMFLINKSMYTFKKTLVLTQLTGKEPGFVEIKFRNDSTNTTKSNRTYRIVNQFTSEKNKIIFSQSEYLVDLK